MSEEKLLERMSRLTLHDNRVAVMEQLLRKRLSFLSESSPEMLLSEEILLAAKQKAKEDDVEKAIRLLSNGIAVERYVQLFVRFVEDVRNIVARDQSLLALAGKLSEDSELATELTRSMIENSEKPIAIVAERFGFEEEFLRFVAETPFVPLFREVASVYVVREMNLKACPVCRRRFSLGYYSVRPPLGWERFSGIRRRYMLCLLCGTSVPASEIWCPRCWPSDTEKIGFIQLENEPHFAIDYCSKCKTYIKAIDIDIVGKPVDPLVLDYSTFDLDGIAKQQGLRSALTD